MDDYEFKHDTLPPGAAERQLAMYRKLLGLPPEDHAEPTQEQRDLQALREQFGGAV